MRSGVIFAEGYGSSLPSCKLLYSVDLGAKEVLAGVEAGAELSWLAASASEL